MIPVVKVGEAGKDVGADSLETGERFLRTEGPILHTDHRNCISVTLAMGKALAAFFFFPPKEWIENWTLAGGADPAAHPGWAMLQPFPSMEGPLWTHFFQRGS